MLKFADSKQALWSSRCYLRGSICYFRSCIHCAADSTWDLEDPRCYPGRSIHSGVHSMCNFSNL